MEVLETLVQEHKDEVRREIINSRSWMEKLIESVKTLPKKFIQKLDPFVEGNYPLLLNTPSLNDAEDSKKNAMVMSMLYGHLIYLSNGLFNEMRDGDNFMPSELQKAINVLRNTKNAVHQIYQAELRAQPVRDKLFPWILIPTDSAVEFLIPFLQDYEFVKKYEYISTFKQVYESKVLDEKFNGLSEDKKVNFVYHSHNLTPDPNFTRISILPYVNNSWDSLILEFLEQKNNFKKNKKN